MKNLELKKYIIGFVLGILFLIFLLISFFLGKKFSNNIIDKSNIVRDTLVIKDTLIIKDPIEKVRLKDNIVYIPIKNIDTIRIYDTITNKEETNIALQKEKVIYEDSTYKAIISGIYPKLEEITIYPKTLYITEKEKIQVKKRFNLNVSAGPGVLYNGKLNYGIGVVIGIGYSF